MFDDVWSCLFYDEDVYVCTWRTQRSTNYFGGTYDWCLLVIIIILYVYINIYYDTFYVELWWITRGLKAWQWLQMIDDSTYDGLIYINVLYHLIQ